MKQLHPTQKQLLTTLLSSQGALRHTQLLPESVERDSFNYHLRQLLKLGLVYKLSSGYALTQKGTQFIEEVNPLDPLGNTGELFRLNILLIVEKHRGKSKYLLNQKRTRQPFYGEVGIPGGSVRRGEPITQAAKRKLEEETGLVAEFSHIGLIRKFRYDTSHQLLEDILFHLCFANRFQSTLISSTPFGENYWVSVPQAIINESAAQQGSAAVIEVLGKIKQEEPLEEGFFYREEQSILQQF